MPRPPDYPYVDLNNPQPRGRCDRGGEIRPLNELRKEMVWVGERLQWNGWLVCDRHRDPPHPQDKPEVLPPDPVPVENPRPDIDAAKTRAMPVTSFFKTRGVSDTDMQPPVAVLESQSVAPVITPDPTPSPGLTPPVAASSAGYATLAFDDEFSSDTVSDSSTSRNWYPYNPYGGPILNAAQYGVSGGNLVISTDASGYSSGLTSISSLNPTAISRPGSIAANGGNGLLFQFGYFEARLKYDNTLSPRTPTGHSWPAFWSNAIQGPQNQADNYAELDFMEAWPINDPPYILMSCTLHEWTRGWTIDHEPSGINDNVQTLNNIITPPDFVQDGFNTYGCLWTPTSVEWFINNQSVASVAIGAATPYPSAATNEVYLVLGTGQNWPVTFDYVRVWQ